MTDGNLLQWNRESNAAWEVATKRQSGLFRMLSCHQFWVNRSKSITGPFNGNGITDGHIDRQTDRQYRYIDRQRDRDTNWINAIYNSFSVDSSSWWLKIGDRESQNYDHKCCHFVLDRLCQRRHKHGRHVWQKVTNTSQANFVVCSDFCLFVVVILLCFCSSLRNNAPTWLRRKDLKLEAKNTSFMEILIESTHKGIISARNT